MRGHATLETQRAMATFQPSPSADQVVGIGGAPVKNTSLNSVVPVGWTIGRTSTPSWSIGTSRKDRPRCRWEPGSVRATHEAPVRQVGQGGPDLLAVDHVVVAASSARPWSRRWPGRNRRPARSSPGTRTPRPRRSSAGSAASAPRCRRRSASGRAAPRRGGSPGPVHRRGRTPRGRSPAGTAAARGRRTPRASRCRSSRAWRGAGPRRRARRTPRARGPATLAAELREVAGEGLLQPRRGPRRGTPRPRGCR